MEIQGEVARRIEQSRIIVAVRDAGDLPAALDSPHPVVFLLASEIGSLAAEVATVRRAGKSVFVHLDLVSGLRADSHALRWLAETVAPDGIITTRASIISPARSLGLATVQRTFLMDSQSVKGTLDQVRRGLPHFLEILPGIAPEGIALVARQVDCPVIAGGLVREVRQVKAALAAGAVAISTSSKKLWATRFD